MRLDATQIAGSSWLGQYAANILLYPTNSYVGISSSPKSSELLIATCWKSVQSVMARPHTQDLDPDAQSEYNWFEALRTSGILSYPTNSYVGISSSPKSSELLIATCWKAVQSVMARPHTQDLDRYAWDLTAQWSGLDAIFGNPRSLEHGGVPNVWILVPAMFVPVLQKSVEKIQECLHDLKAITTFSTQLSAVHAQLAETNPKPTNSGILDSLPNLTQHADSIHKIVSSLLLLGGA